jgi:hypothetical protein
MDVLKQAKRVPNLSRRNIGTLGYIDPICNPVGYSLKNSFSV